MCYIILTAVTDDDGDERFRFCMLSIMLLREYSESLVVGKNYFLQSRRHLLVAGVVAGASCMRELQVLF